MGIDGTACTAYAVAQGVSGLSFLLIGFVRDEYSTF